MGGTEEGLSKRDHMNEVFGTLPDILKHSLKQCHQLAYRIVKRQAHGIGVVHTHIYNSLHALIQ